MAGLAYGQLIIDEDDPAGKKLIDKMMHTINEHEKTTYTFKSVVYSLPIGNEEKISVLLKVTDAHGVRLIWHLELKSMLAHSHYHRLSCNATSS